MSKKKLGKRVAKLERLVADHHRRQGEILLQTAEMFTAEIERIDALTEQVNALTEQLDGEATIYAGPEDEPTIVYAGTGDPAWARQPTSHCRCGRRL